MVYRIFTIYFKVYAEEDGSRNTGRPKKTKFVFGHKSGIFEQFFSQGLVIFFLKTNILVGGGGEKTNSGFLTNNAYFG